MNKNNKELFGKIPAASWTLLPLMMIVGIAIHTNDYVYWALWLTEALSYAVIALYLWRPSKTLPVAVAAAAGIWLVNQVFCWYVYGPFGNFVYIATLILNLAVFGLALIWRSSSKGMEWLASVGLGIMMLFAGWKLYAVSQGLAGTAAVSAALWGGGIFVLSLGTIIHLNTKKNQFTVYICLAGLLIASVAALYYGTALSLV